VTVRVVGTDLRVGDVDRDRCVDQLTGHFVAGRLDRCELEERVEKALVARSHNQLTELIADCEHVTKQPADRQKNVRACVAGVVVALSFVGLTSLVLPGAPAQSPACVATGVAAPVDVECPAMTRQQERLMQDADQAAAAAEQVQTTAKGADDAQLKVLADEAQAAAQRAKDAVAAAQMVVATTQEKIGEHSLDAPAQQARSAATDAVRAAVQANTIAHR
jgi:membrane-associated HD superfamily phosphohydrolase